MALDEKQIAAAVAAGLSGLQQEVSTIGNSTTKVLECLVNGPPTPDLLPEEKIVPTAARQDETQNKLILTLTVPSGAPTRDVEVVFEDAEASESPKKESSSKTKSGGILLFDLPQSWRNDRKPRFVAVNIMDPTKPPPPTATSPTPPITPTMRRILPATVPNYDEDDD
jgi:hypothetical protein